jgi:hypothetical protein
MMQTGVTEAWEILIILFVATVFVLPVRWTVALLLFFFGPFAGTLMTLLAQMVGQIGEVHRPNFLWQVIGVYALDLPYVVGLHSAVLATALVLLYSRYGSSPDFQSRIVGRRVATGALVGSTVGGLFATLILLLAWLTHQNPEFADFISGGTRDGLDLSTEVLLSVCTGAVDGALIAIVGPKVFGPKHFDRAAESAMT